MEPAEILAAIEGVNMLIGFIDRRIAEAKERGEWTPEQEAEFDAKLAATKAKAYWQK